MTHLKTTDWFCFTLRCLCGSGTICSAAPAAAGKIRADVHQTFFLYNEEAALSSGRMHHSTFIFPEITSYYSTCWAEWQYKKLHRAKKCLKNIFQCKFNISPPRKTASAENSTKHFPPFFVPVA